MSQNTELILRRLFEDETITIAPCDGSRLIGKQKKTFPVYIDSCFEIWGLNISGKPTDATTVSIHEMVKDATFAQMFDSLGSDLDKLCLTQSQIIEFCEKHRSKLHQDGYATLFPIKKGDHFFVARVGVVAAGLGVSVNRFGYGHVWYGGCRHRVVTPQLTV